MDCQLIRLKMKIRLYNGALKCVTGGFSWRLDFFWEWLPPRDRARRLRDPTTSYKTPAMAGGLFAINREWFMELGSYDTDMNVRTDQMRFQSFKISIQE